MKVGQLCQALDSLVPILDSRSSQLLKALTETLKPFATRSIAQVAKQAGTVGDELRTEGADTVRSLRLVLRSVRGVVENVGSKAAVKDMDLLDAMLLPHDSSSASQFLSTLETHLSASAKPASTKKVGVEKPPNIALIKGYLDRLEDANENPSQFSAVLTSIDQDKDVRKDVELTEIANKFYGVDHRYKTKKEALAQIMKRHQQDERSRIQGSAIIKMKI